MRIDLGVVCRCVDGILLFLCRARKRFARAHACGMPLVRAEGGAAAAPAPDGDVCEGEDVAGVGGDIRDVVMPWHALPYSEQLTKKQAEIEHALKRVRRKLRQTVRRCSFVRVRSCWVC